MIALPAGGIGGLKKKGARKKRQHDGVIKAVLRYVSARVDELKDLGKDDQTRADGAEPLPEAATDADAARQKQQQQQATALLERHRKELEDLLAGFRQAAGAGQTVRGHSFQSVKHTNGLSGYNPSKSRL